MQFSNKLGFGENILTLIFMHVVQACEIVSEDFGFLYLLFLMSTSMKIIVCLPGPYKRNF